MGFANPLVGSELTVGGTVTTSPAVAVLVNTSSITPAPSVTLGPFTVPFAAQTIAVTLDGLVNDLASAQVANTTTGDFSCPQTMKFVTSGANAPLFFPVAAAAGDQIEITLDAVTTVNAPVTTVLVRALAAVVQPSPLRADGRLYPVGMFATYGIATTVPIVLVGAPGAGNRLLVHSLSMGLNGGATGSVNLVVEGARTDVLYGDTGAGVGVNLGNMIPPQGLLCDANTDIEIGWIQGGMIGMCSYDIVK